MTDEIEMLPLDQISDAGPAAVVVAICLVLIAYRSVFARFMKPVEHPAETALKQSQSQFGTMMQDLKHVVRIADEMKRDQRDLLENDAEIKASMKRIEKDAAEILLHMKYATQHIAPGPRID